MLKDIGDDSVQAREVSGVTDPYWHLNLGLQSPFMKKYISVPKATQSMTFHYGTPNRLTQGASRFPKMSNIWLYW